eukprot:gene1121-656_t
MDPTSAQAQEDEDQQYYTSMVMMASNYTSVKKMSQQQGGPVTKKGKGTRRAPPAQNPSAREFNPSSNASVPANNASAQKASTHASPVAQYPPQLNSGDMTYFRNDSIASSVSSLYSNPDQCVASPLGEDTHVDITFPDPPTIASVNKEGVVSYRHNPYSRSVSTVVTNPQSMCASFRSSLASSLSQFDSPSQMVLNGPGNAFGQEPHFSSAASTSSCCSMDSGCYGGQAYQQTMDIGSYHVDPTPEMIPSTGKGNRRGNEKGARQANSRQAPSADQNVDHANNNNFSSNLHEQYESIVEHLETEACSARGRQLLVHILRLRDTEKSLEVFSKLLPHANAVSLDSNGCHVARALVENLPTSDVLQFIHSLYPATIFRLCTTSQHTRRVVQAIFENHRGPELTPLVEVLANDACRLAVTQQGCIIIMNVLSHAMVDQKALFLPHLMPILATLATDQYGNYVVQALFDNREGLVTMEELNSAFGKHRIPHSCHKCASNVMEKLVSSVTGITRRQMVQEFIFDPLHCHTLLLDCYGNFVLQAIIKSSKEPAEFQVIYDTVVSYLPNSPYGQKIGAKLQAKYREIFHTEPPAAPQPPSGQPPARQPQHAHTNYICSITMSFLLCIQHPFGDTPNADLASQESRTWENFSIVFFELCSAERRIIRPPLLTLWAILKLELQSLHPLTLHLDATQFFIMLYLFLLDPRALIE